MDVTLSKLRKKGWFDEVAGLLLLLFTAITVGALLSYQPSDPTWFQSQPEPRRAANWTGRVGATLAELLLQLLGTAAFLVPVVFAVTGWNRFRGKSRASSYGRLLGLTALVASLATLLDLLYGSIRYGSEVFPAGGYVGAKIAGALIALMNPLGCDPHGGRRCSRRRSSSRPAFPSRTPPCEVGDGMGGWLAAGRERLAAYREERRREAQKKRAREEIRDHGKRPPRRSRRGDAKPRPPIPLDDARGGRPSSRASQGLGARSPPQARRASQAAAAPSGAAGGRLRASAAGALERPDAAGGGEREGPAWRARSS